MSYHSPDLHHVVVLARYEDIPIRQNQCSHNPRNGNTMHWQPVLGPSLQHIQHPARHPVWHRLEYILGWSFHTVIPLPLLPAMPVGSGLIDALWHFPTRLIDSPRCNMRQVGGDYDPLGHCHSHSCYFPYHVNIYPYIKKYK